MLGFHLHGLVISVNIQVELWALLSFHSPVTKILGLTEMKRGTSSQDWSYDKRFEAMWRLQIIIVTTEYCSEINPLYRPNLKPPTNLRQQRAKQLNCVEPKSKLFICPPWKPICTYNSCKGQFDKKDQKSSKSSIQEKHQSIFLLSPFQPISTVTIQLH